MKRAIQIAAILTAMTAGGPLAKADKIIVSSISYPDVRIGAVAKSTITFRMAGGKIVTKSVLAVNFINMTGLPLLNEAEDLLAEGKAREAVALYEKAENAEMPAARPGLKLLLAYRKLEAAKKAGMIATATATWLQVMDANDAEASVVGLRPKAPKTKSPDNDRAIKLLKAKEGVANKAYAAAVKELRIQLLNLQGRTDESRVLATDLATGTDVGAEYVIKSKLAAAASYIKTKDANKAIELLGPLMKQCDHSYLPKAMLLLGRAQMILAHKAEGQEKHKLLCEAGLNFVRVAAFFGGAKEEASEALYYAGRVNESLAKPNIEAARKAYTEVIKRYKDTPAATEANKALSALKGK